MIRLPPAATFVAESDARVRAGVVPGVREAEKVTMMVETTVDLSVVVSSLPPPPAAPARDAVVTCGGTSLVAVAATPRGGPVVVPARFDDLVATTTGIVPIVTSRLFGRFSTRSASAISAHPTYTPSVPFIGRAKQAWFLGHADAAYAPATHVARAPLMQAMLPAVQAEVAEREAKSVL